MAAAPAVKVILPTELKLAPAAINPFLSQAKDLFHNHGLSIAGEIYEFTELEFYWYAAAHPDPYVHCHPEQQARGKWYFHRPTHTSPTYKGGTFKGLDLTWGDSTTYFGVLIRSIYHPRTGAISGPCNVVDHILKSYQVDSIATLVGEHGPLSVHANERKLCLVPAKSDPSLPMYLGPRVGLSTKDINYQAKEYRFVRRYTDQPKLKAKRTLRLLN